MPLLLAVFFIAGGLSLRNDSATFDETAHVPAGYTSLDHRDFRLNPEHPPLSKLWAALPLWLDQRNEADYGSPYWSGRSVQPGTTLRTAANQWAFGFEFLNGRLGAAQRKDPARLLVPARLMMLLWGLLLGLVVYAWARDLWGADGGLLALFLYCLSPTMLAHSRLVTTDLPAALGFTLTLWCFWRFTHEPSKLRGALVGLALAAALLIKFSSVLLIPILAVVGAAWAYVPRLERWERSGRSTRVVYVLIAALLIAWLGIWAGYGFRYPASPDPLYQLDWDVVGLEEGPLARAVYKTLDLKLLPQAYLYGTAYFLGGAERRLAFLNGEESLIGWWYYFPEAFLLKTTPTLLVLLALVVALGVVHRRWRSFDGWYLALPVLIYFGVSMFSALNIGQRHLVPIYPLLFIAAGGVAYLLPRFRWRAVVLALLLAGQALSFGLATPGYLSYFNFLAGGSGGGWRYLLDSNIDWGQDLGRLATLMERRGIGQVHLAYFGTADPKAYGIDFRKVHLVHDFYPNEPVERPRSGDYLAVSVNLLQGLYYDRAGEFARAVVGRRWVPTSKIDEWVDLRDRFSKRRMRHPDLADWLVEQGAITRDQREQVEARLLSTWLAGIRDTLEPVAEAGDSIFLYRIP